MAACARKRQRRHNVSSLPFNFHDQIIIKCLPIFLQKAKARLRVLNLSSGLDDARKEQIKPVLQAKYMSSEESLVEDSSEDEDRDDHSGSGSDTAENTRSKSGKKKLVRHTLEWRSQEYEAVVRSLDRKLDRRRNPKSKAMCLEVQIGGPSSREKPDNAPEWTVNMHYQLFET